MTTGDTEVFGASGMYISPPVGICELSTPKMDGNCREYKLGVH